ncbi:MAG: ATP-binding protein [Aminobacterium colombiense]|jgi:two-component system phosphate regulon sensor histidine kinase PhoR|uniref:sensor histidine kinase n=1 Tax=Aminobacterium TaxID=81466 RepID=UPI00257D757A|nr:ATP-binding protein [Aminobacterium sp. EBM-42]MDD2379717.1 ATP-binding protein [Aminobacterium colombiense]MDD4265473.1 ATP-binding protein [Aminobacterium colombiense]MDD4586480.1 ATP-binding protein [Aminobacterium colombiense]
MKTLKGKVTAVLTFVTVIAFAVSWFLVSGIMKHHLVDSAFDQLKNNTAALSEVIRNEGYSSFQKNFSQWQEIFESRITIINAKGRVILDSATDAETLDNHLNRPEVRQAAKDGVGTTSRYSQTLGAQLVYVVRKVEGGEEDLFIRMAQPLNALQKALSDVRYRFLSYIIMAAFLILGFELWIVRRFFAPLEKIVTAAQAISEGNEARFPLMGDMELQRLSDSLQYMSSRLKGTLEELKIERTTLSTILSSLPVGVILLDKDNRFRFVNDEARNLLGMKVPVEEGQPIERFLTCGEIYPLLKEAKGGVEQAIKVEMPELGKGGRHLSLYGRQTESGPLLVITDLTEEFRQEQARRDFIADAGHEFQTPLTTIRLTAEYLQDELRGNEDMAGHLQSIIQQQERMTQLVDDLLLLSRLESQPPQEAEEELDLAFLVDTITGESLHHPLAEAIDIEKVLPEEALMIGQSRDLARAIRNIIDNSIKYVHEKFGGSGGGKVRIELFSRDSWWVIQVQDNGVGISEEAAATIFDRFSRGDSHRARGQWGSGGYGLGLAIARRIFMAHGGDITLIAANGGQTIFEITLPMENSKV